MSMRKIINVEGIKVPVGSHEGKRIIIGADHRGFSYKNEIMGAAEEKGYQLIDIGTSSPERCDYPIISDNIGEGVSKDPDFNTVGIGICGSGIGILIPASKHKGIYTARCLSPEEAETSRRHNNTNVLGIAADYMDLETVLDTVNAWLTAPFYSNCEDEDAYLNRYIQTVKLETDALGL